MSKKLRKPSEIILKDGRTLEEVLELHKKWLNCEGGERADLRGAILIGTDLSDCNLRYSDLSNSDLSNANLRYSDLSDCNLSNANLSDCNLSYADLVGADLSYADLSRTDLSDSDLNGVDLSYADLRYSNLSYADLSDSDLSNTDLSNSDLSNANLRYTNLNNIKFNHLTSFFALQCPEEGQFIAYKKARDMEAKDYVIVKMLVTEDSLRSSATTRKCRFSKIKVLNITSLDGTKEYQKACSNHNMDFIYEVGKVLEVKDFDEDRWNECSTGIHGFITRQEAVNYKL